MSLPRLHTWSAPSDAVRQLLHGATLRTCTPVALVVGTVLSAVNQGDVLLAGMGDGRVVDGNYRSRVGDLLHPDTYLWLDHPRRVVLQRVLRRTLGRVVLRRELWNGNRERWRNLLDPDPRENIVLWSWTKHEHYRRAFAAMSAQDTGARWVRLRHPREVERWLGTVAASPGP